MSTRAVVTGQDVARLVDTIARLQDEVKAEARLRVQLSEDSQRHLDRALVAERSEQRVREAAEVWECKAVIATERVAALERQLAQQDESIERLREERDRAREQRNEGRER